LGANNMMRLGYHSLPTVDQRLLRVDVSNEEYSSMVVGPMHYRSQTQRNPDGIGVVGTKILNDRHLDVK